MTCRSISRLLALHVGGDLPERDVARVEEHLAGCDGCREELHAYGASRQTLFALKGDRAGPAPDLWPGIRQQLHAFETPARGISLPVRAAAAAVILLVVGLVAATVSFRTGQQPVDERPEVPAPVASAAEDPRGPREYVLSEVVAGGRYDPFPSVTPPDPDRGAWDEF